MPCERAGDYEPPSDQIHCARKEPGFSNAQHDAADHEAGEVLNYPGERHDDTPRDDEDADVGRWTLEILENDVARHF